MRRFSIDANDWLMDGLEQDRKLINDLAQWAGKRPSRLATDLGMAATTLARPASGKATTRLGRRVLEALQEAFPEFPGWDAAQGGEPIEMGQVHGIPIHPRIADPTSKREPDVPPARLATEDDGTVELQRLDLSLSMGPGTLIDDYVEAEPVRFDPSFVRLITRAPYHRLKLVTGIGDSMYPTLNWGDTIMIDTTDRALAKQDAIYWISVYGASGLKRLRAIGKGRVLVVSDNPSVPDQEVDAEDLRIEGRAVWFARGL